MKTKLFFLLFAACFSMAAKAQTSIPNGNFESWTVTNFYNPQFYNSSSAQSLGKCGVNSCIRSADPYHGSYAIQLTTISGDCVGFVVNTPRPDGNPMNWPGGAAYNQVATGIKGYYKSNIAAGDSAIVMVNFKLNGSSIGFYMQKFYGTHSSYTPFAFTFNPPLPITPDTVIFGAVSSDVFNSFALPGSMFQIDSVSFTGVTSQPATFNGDFELWQPDSLVAVDSWFPQSEYERTSDAEAGNYAIKLTTLPGDHNGNPVARSAGISTGYSNGSNMFGGYPYTQQIDTLAFHYKYTPASGDSASIMMNFRKNGTSIFGAGMNLGATANYQYVEIPFVLFQVPDTVIVSVQSSKWPDTTANYIGSVLIIDEIQFKSQPLNTGIAKINDVKNLVISPNPSQGEFIIQYDAESAGSVFYYLIDETGRIIKQNEMKSALIKIDIRDYPKGLYFLRIEDGGNVITKKVIVL